MSSIFTVYEQYTRRVVLETDDWVEAEQKEYAGLYKHPPVLLSIRGTHPTHDWGPPHEGQGDRSPRCRKCGAWDNTSYGSHAPCGYDFRGGSLAAAIERELAARAA